MRATAVGALIADDASDELSEMLLELRWRREHLFLPVDEDADEGNGPKKDHGHREPAAERRQAEREGEFQVVSEPPGDGNRER